MKFKALFLVCLLVISTTVEAFSKQNFVIKIEESESIPCVVCPVKIQFFQVVPGKIYIQYEGNRNFEGVGIKPIQELRLYKNGVHYVLTLPAVVVGANGNNVEVEYDYDGDLGIGISTNQFIITEDGIVE